MNNIKCKNLVLTHFDGKALMVANLLDLILAMIQI